MQKPGQNSLLVLFITLCMIFLESFIQLKMFQSAVGSHAAMLPGLIQLLLCISNGFPNSNSLLNTQHLQLLLKLTVTL